MSITTIRKNRRTAIDPDDLYPDGDGEPMAETDQHLDQMIDNITSLKNYFADDPNVYVAGNNFVYWQEGDPKRFVSPDCYAVFGVEKRLRRTYMVWKENGHVPNVVIEVTSNATRREDRGNKRRIYEQTLRVPEYFQFDPIGDYLNPRLQGVRLVDGVYEPIELVDRTLYSEQLKLDIVWEGERMRFRDPSTGVFLQTYDDQRRRADIAENRAHTVEEENARLRDEIEALRERPL